MISTELMTTTEAMTTTEPSTTTEPMSTTKPMATTEPMNTEIVTNTSLFYATYSVNGTNQTMTDHVTVTDIISHLILSSEWDKSDLTDNDTNTCTVLPRTPDGPQVMYSLDDNCRTVKVMATRLYYIRAISRH